MNNQCKRSRRKKGQTQISISLPVAVVKKIDKIANGENRNRSNMIVCALEQFIADADQHKK